MSLTLQQMHDAIEAVAHERLGEGFTMLVSDKVDREYVDPVREEWPKLKIVFDDTMPKDRIYLIDERRLSDAWAEMENRAIEPLKPPIECWLPEISA